MRGANPAAVQRIMRRGDPKITTEVYSHLAPGYLRAEVDRLAFGLATEPAEATEARQSAIAGWFVTPSLPAVGDGVSRAAAGSDFPEGLPVAAVERDTGFEPATFSLGRSRRPSQRLAALINHVKTLSLRPGQDPIPPSV